MYTRVLMAGLLLLSRTVWSAEPDVHAWHWQRTLTVATPPVEQCVVLDADLYARAAPGLRDVRLLQEGHEVPYALEESFDEHAAGSPGSDRGVYTTVLQIPLSPVAGEHGPRTYRGEAVLAAHVPVERIELVPARSGSFPAGDAPVEFSLSATPLSPDARRRGPVPESELIQAVLQGRAPAERTALGANLQKDAAVLVTASSERVSAVLLQMHQRLLCFKPLSTAPLTVLFGNASARPVRYAYGAHYQPLAQPVLGQLGQVQLNPAYRNAAGEFPLWNFRRVALVACALLLALALWTALLSFASRR